MDIKATRDLTLSYTYFLIRLPDTDMAMVELSRVERKLIDGLHTGSVADKLHILYLIASKLEQQKKEN